MKKLALILVLFIPAMSFSETLPKDCYGFYAGEMGSYTVVKNDMELLIQRQEVEVHISGNYIAYTSGNLTLKGTYTFLKQSSTHYLIKTKLSNGKNVNYQLDLLWDKKKRTLFLAGKNGEPDLLLEKLEK